jgi:hypothetical protein
MSIKVIAGTRVAASAREGALTVAVLMACTGCVLAGARGAGATPASIGPDGVIIAARAEPMAARDATLRALRANGFDVDGSASSRSTVRTRTRIIASDTSIVLSAFITPVDLGTTKSMITLSGTISVPSSRIRNAQLVWSPEHARGPWRFLEAVRDSLRQIAPPAP